MIRRALLCLPLLCLAATGCGGSKPKVAPVHLLVDGRVSYDLPLGSGAKDDPDESVRLATELMRAKTAKGVKWSNGRLDFESSGAVMTLNGKSCGGVRSGDRVKLTADGRLFVNDVERKPGAGIQ